MCASCIYAAVPVRGIPGISACRYTLAKFDFFCLHEDGAACSVPFHNSRSNCLSLLDFFFSVLETTRSSIPSLLPPLLKREH